MARDRRAKVTPGGLRRWVAARTWVLPLIVLLCVTLPHLSDGDWMRTDSGWYAAIGTQAWRSGELLTLYGEPGQPYFNKPPLVFWIVGLPMHVFGPSAWTARLMTLAAAAGCVLLTVSMARQGMSRRGAMWAGITLALTYEFFRRTREISLDMWQALFLLMAMRLVVGAIVGGAIVGGRARGVVLAGVPIGLALMCKPLVGLAAIPIFGVMLVWCGRWRMLPWLLGTLAAAIVVAAPWHLAMWQIHGELFTSQYFGAEIVDRASGGAVVNEGGAGRWWFYLEKIGEGYWPWLLAVACCVIARMRRRRIGGDSRVLVCAAVWAVGWIVILSVFPDRRDRYGIVFYPGLGVLVGAWLAYRARAIVRGAMRGVERHAWWAMPIAAGAFAAVPVRVQSPVDPQWPEMFAFLESRGNPELWQGAMIGHRGSRIYIETGKWPVTTRDRWGTSVATPPGGALIVYHGHDGLTPGPGERVEFQSGALTITRLEEDATWQPVGR